jgi:aspartate/glutamate racemase
MWSVDFAEIEAMQHESRWNDAGCALADAAVRLARAGAQTIILGCTEIGLLIKDVDVDMPSFDTTRLHAEAAVHWAIE